MDDQTTWKGHSFTLLIFTGIVVLCSIFFTLGMLVGRAQGQKIAEIASVEAASKTEATAEPKDSKPQLTFFDDVQKNAKPALEPPPVVEATKPTPPQPPPPETPKPSAPAINYQIGALRQQADAEKLLNGVKARGFKGFILSPAPRDANPWYRVQVGPFADMVEAESARKKLEAAGYQPILKK